jgi:hypothetical protein
MTTSRRCFALARVGIPRFLLCLLFLVVAGVRLGLIAGRLVSHSPLSNDNWRNPVGLEG